MVSLRNTKDASASMTMGIHCYLCYPNFFSARSMGLFLGTACTVSGDNRTSKGPRLNLRGEGNLSIFMYEAQICTQVQCYYGIKLSREGNGSIKQNVPPPKMKATPL